MKPIRTKDLLTTPEPPHLVKGLISRQGICTLTAEPNVGKTFLSIEIGRCVSEGEALFGRFPVQRGAVLFVGQDCSVPQYGTQARKVLAQYERDFPHLHWWLHDNLDLKQAKDVARLIEVANRIPNPEFDPDVPIDWILEEVEGPDGTKYMDWRPIYGRAYGPALIILDTWSKMHRADENNNSDANRLGDALRLIARKTDATILMVHHPGHQSEYNKGSRPRGASALIGFVDEHLELKGTRRSSKKKLLVQKFRGIPSEDFSFEMHTDETTCRFEFGAFKEEEKDDAATLSVVDEIKAFILAMGPGIEFESRQVADFLVEKRGYTKGSAAVAASKYLVSIELAGDVSRCGRGTWLTRQIPS